MSNTISKSENDSALLEAPSSSEPEVRPVTSKRYFTAKYKLSTLNELDRCTAPGEKGAILRREGLYSSQITDWRRQRNEGALSALHKVRGRKKRHDAKDLKINELEKSVGVLKARLLQAEAIIDVQKKVSEIFGSSTQSNICNGSSL